VSRGHLLPEAQEHERDVTQKMLKLQAYPDWFCEITVPVAAPSVSYAFTLRQ
jgi:hypothetical protein